MHEHEHEHEAQFVSLIEGCSKTLDSLCCADEGSRWSARPFHADIYSSALLRYARTAISFCVGTQCWVREFVQVWLPANTGGVGVDCADSVSDGRTSQFAPCLLEFNVASETAFAGVNNNDGAWLPCWHSRGVFFAPTLHTYYVSDYYCLLLA